MTQYLDYTGLQQYTNIVKQKLSELSGRGRYLSNWNCVTGLPTTNPDTLPYPYKSGDYFIVSNVHSNPGPERAIDTKAGSVEYTFDSATYIEKTQHSADWTDMFVYTDILVDKKYPNLGNDSIVVIDRPQLLLTFEDVEEGAQAYLDSSDDGTLVEVNYYIIRYFSNDTTWYIAIGVNGIIEKDGSRRTENVTATNLTVTGLISNYTEEEWKQVVIDTLNGWGLDVLNGVTIGDVVTQQTFNLTKTNEMQWTINGAVFDNEETIADYGITVTSEPEFNDSIKINYITEKWNYKPVGTSYTGTASTTIESDHVKANDTYIFDGSTWILFKNTVFIDDHLSLVSENAVQNKVVTAALNKKSGVIFRDFEPEEESN